MDVLKLFTSNSPKKKTERDNSAGRTVGGAATLNLTGEPRTSGQENHAEQHKVVKSWSDGIEIVMTNNSTGNCNLMTRVYSSVTVYNYL